MKLCSFWRSLATYRVRIALTSRASMPDEVVDVRVISGVTIRRAVRPAPLGGS